MFKNLRLSEFTWSREPILYITLAVAILNVVITVLSGDIELTQGLESIGLLVFGFIARGRVTPVN